MKDSEGRAKTVVWAIYNLLQLVCHLFPIPCHARLRRLHHRSTLDTPPEPGGIATQLAGIVSAPAIATIARVCRAITSNVPLGTAE